MDLTLVIHEGAGTPRHFRVAEDERGLIGRSGDIRVRNDRASRRHAEVWFEAGRWRLRDLGSLNGTRVNGKRIGETVTLKAGDEVEVGKARLMVRVSETAAEDEAKVAAPVPEPASDEILSAAEELGIGAEERPSPADHVEPPEEPAAPIEIETDETDEQPDMGFGAAMDASLDEPEVAEPEAAEAEVTETEPEKPEAGEPAPPAAEPEIELPPEPEAEVPEDDFKTELKDRDPPHVERSPDEEVGAGLLNDFAPESDADEVSVEAFEEEVGPVEDEEGKQSVAAAEDEEAEEDEVESGINLTALFEEEGPTAVEEEEKSEEETYRDDVPQASIAAPPTAAPAAVEPTPAPPPAPTLPRENVGDPTPEAPAPSGSELLRRHTPARARRRMAAVLLSLMAIAACGVALWQADRAGLVSIDLVTPPAADAAGEDLAPGAEERDGWLQHVETDRPATTTGGS